jgi:hypothetical protein
MAFAALPMCNDGCMFCCKQLKVWQDTYATLLQGSHPGVRARYVRTPAWLVCVGGGGGRGPGTAARLATSQNRQDLLTWAT